MLANGRQWLSYLGPTLSRPGLFFVWPARRTDNDKLSEGINDRPAAAILCQNCWFEKHRPCFPGHKWKFEKKLKGNILQLNN